MRLKELRERLSNYPDDAVVEVSCAGIDPEDRWFAIVGQIGDESPATTEHILLLLGEPTME